MCKKLIYLISFILVLSLVSNASADLAAHWQFDDGTGTTAVDSSGNGHDGTLLLDPQWVAGKFGGALEFGGISGQRVEMEGYEGILGTQDRTVMAWIKTTGLGDWISWGQNTNTQKWIGRVNDNESNGQVGALRTECSGGYIISTTVLTDGEWHHVTSVLESAGSPTIEDIKMYVDGFLETVSGFRPVGIDTVGGRNVWIGDGHHDRPFPSVIDDVRIYNHAMTGLEIVAAKEGVEQVDMEIGFAIQPPVIDGEVDDIWAVASTQSIVPVDDPANASGSWQALYDSENLYVIVDITDDSLVNDTDSSWQDDSVEFYFDGGNTKDVPPLAGDNHQYTFGWTTEDIQGSNIDGYTEGIEHAQVDTGTGWRIEIKMPWMSIQGVEPMAGDLIGIDCFYNDDDDGGTSREAQIWTFATDGSAWNDASQWGTAVLASTPEPVDPGTDGLVAFYALDGDPNDSSGNELHGTIIGEPAFVEGQVGMALDFDGTDDVVELGKIDVVGGITLAAWIKPDDFGINDARIITKANEWSGDSHWWMLSTISETSLRFRLKTDEGPSTATLISDSVLEAGVFTHVAATWDGSMMRIYKDGIEIASQEKGGSAVAVDPDVSAAIGSQPSDAFASDPSHVVKFFDGLIDEVQIYERALSEGELLYLAGYRAPVDPGTEGLVAQYSLENDVLDSSGNGNDGTIVGAPIFIDGQAGYGMAMEFDGESLVDCGSDASLDVTGPISIALWIRPGADDPEGQGTEAAPMAKADSGASPSWSWQVRYGWNSPQPFMAFTFNTSPRAWAYVGKNLERDEWAHIACSHDGETLKCYLDGEETDSTPMGAITSSPTPVLIGSDGWRSDWIGAIDEVVIYDRALSVSEIMYLAGK